MEHTSEWDDIRSWHRRQEELRRQREAELRRKEQVVQALSPLPLRVIPLPWEDLTSLLCRTARKMGYEHPRWMLHPEHIPYSIDPAALPLLHRRTDYLFLQRLLLLEEEQLYRLTLHAFTDRLRLVHPQNPDVPDFTAPFGYASSQEIGRPLLWQEQYPQLFQTDKHTRVCPSCLDEQEGYDRLYWRCRLLCTCPKHAVYLVDCCPQCRTSIPALRPTPTTCPICRKGDYRSLILSVFPEETWLLESLTILLHQLGIDDTEIGRHHLTNGSQILESLPSWDYVSLLANGLHAFEQLSVRREAQLSFLSRSLALEATVIRLAQRLRKIPLQLRPLILLHYLYSAWPTHFPIFLAQLQHLLEEEYHYHPESEPVDQWSKAMVRGNFWCLSSYQEQPVSHAQSFFTTFSDYFMRLPLAETGANYARNTLRVTTEPATRQQEATLPHPWESLPSLLMRAAQQRGDASIAWLIHTLGDGRRFWPDSGELLLLEQQQDYALLKGSLYLDEQDLYALTLHHFSSVLQPPTSLDHSFWSSVGAETIGHPFLSDETIARHCLPRGTTRLCSACLEENQPYERLFWNLRSVLLCLHHRIFLIDRCPSCQRPIPSLRSKASQCPSCHRGDYRTAERVAISQHSILYQSQHLLLWMLGIHDPFCLDRPSLFFESPLIVLQPWEYADLLERFSQVAPTLRPERTLTALCRALGFPEEPSAYARWGNRKQAVAISLFHTLFGSGPKQVHALLPSSPLREELPRWNEEGQQQQEETSAIYTRLAQLFETQISFSLRDRSSRQRWATQVKR